MEAKRSNIDVLITKIRRYIRNNPAAADSIIGIWQWWISDCKQIFMSVDELQIALEVMEEKGEMMSCKNIDGTCIWRKSSNDNTKKEKL
jgi:hypothetical protein